MREDILRVLSEQGGGYVSGQDLARRLGVSRTAVHKHIAALRAAGYQIESVPRLGHRLLVTPDRVTPAEVRLGLTTAVMGRLVEYRPSVTSTNDLAKELARAGAPEGLLAIAEEQVRGKGRLGRAWVSPPGVGVWMSVVLRPPLAPHEAAPLTLCAAVAVAEAIRATTGVPAGIRWPSDIVVGERKVCGILTELEAEWDRIEFAVVGIGINVNTPPDAFPPDLAMTATSLLAVTGSPVPRAPLVRAVLTRLEAAYREILAGHLDALFARWREYSVTLGRTVRIRPVAAGQPDLIGVAEEIDPAGALVVRLPDGGRRRVLAGDVNGWPAQG